MRLAVDASCWSNRRGFGRYTRELLTHLAPLAAERGYRTILVVDRQTAVEVRASELAPMVEVREAPTRIRPTEAAAADGARSPGDIWCMARTLAGARAEVAFFPAVYSFFPPPFGLPTVVTFHDAIAEEHPDLIFPGWRSRFFWRLKTRWALAAASAVLTVSESARQQVARAFGLDPRTITVSGEGPASGLVPPDDPAVLAAVAERYNVAGPAPRLLYVGGISPHKNLDGLLAACDRLRHLDFKLVLVGDIETDVFHGCYQQLAAQVASLGLEDRMVFTGYVPQDDLAALYGLADVLVLPSWSEGFGLPAVEAMACGVPVAASRGGSLPEVVGDAGLFFDPADHQAMATVLERLLSDPELRRRLGERGLQEVQRHSWEAAAGRVLDLLEKVAGGRP